MNRPEYSLTLDSVICPRCDTISRADEDTCPQCGADRQGAIFTSHADTAAPVHASAAAVPMQEEAFDFVDLRDTGWLTRMARRKMVTSYPSVAEPGDEPLEATQKPARKGLAVLVGGVVATLAAGGYLYTQSGHGVGYAAKTDHAAISVAGAIREKSSTANDANDTDNARHDTLTRDRVAGDKAMSTTATVAASHANQTAQTAPSTPAKASRVDSAANNVPVSKPAATPPALVATPTLAHESTPKSSATPIAQAAVPAPKPATTNATTTPAPQQASIVTPRAAEPVQAVAKPQTPAVAPTYARQTAQAIASTPPARQAEQARAEARPVARTQTLAAATPRPAEPARTPAKPVVTASQSTSASAKENRTRTTLASIEKPAPVATKAADAQDPSSQVVARSIAAVAQSLANRDLSAARRNMRPLRASESRSPEIQQLVADVTRQERARDAALANARICAMNKEPSCAVRNARRAVALDSRNPQTQAALRQAMAVQTEANTAYFRQASALPSPAVPALTFDGRWSATHPHASPSSDDNDRPNYSAFGWSAPGASAASRGRGDAH